MPPLRPSAELTKSVDARVAEEIVRFKIKQQELPRHQALTTQAEALAARFKVLELAADDKDEEFWLEDEAAREQLGAEKKVFYAISQRGSGSVDLTIMLTALAPKSAKRRRAVRDQDDIISDQEVAVRFGVPATHQRDGVSLKDKGVVLGGEENRVDEPTYEAVNSETDTFQNIADTLKLIDRLLAVEEISASLI